MIRYSANWRSVEERLRRGTGDHRRTWSRKQRLVAELEQIYGELDEAASARGGDGRWPPDALQPSPHRTVTIDFDQVAADGVSRHFGRRRALSQHFLPGRPRDDPRAARPERRRQVDDARAARDADAAERGRRSVTERHAATDGRRVLRGAIGILGPRPVPVPGADRSREPRRSSRDSMACRRRARGCGGGPRAIGAGRPR